MSHLLINRSPDLKKLRDEGFDIEIESGYLRVNDVPYVNSKKEIKKGTLVSTLTLAGNITTKPDNHVVYFIGEHPCNQDGSEVTQIKNNSKTIKLGDISVNHTFSAKPISGYYKDYYTKITNYIAILSGRAQLIDSKVSAQTFPVVMGGESETVFNYIDTASSRADINSVTKKLEVGKVAIVGLGGTGSYVLDLIAKTPVKEIHLFDNDKFLQHNAFRAPGAPSINSLCAQPMKVSYYKELYSNMHCGIVAHEFYITSENVELLQTMDFVFFCLDNGVIKKLIYEKVEELSIPFIDVGMGIYMTNDSLGGVLRVTTSEVSQCELTRDRIPFSDADVDNEYSQNIQVADLNSLNASLAVIKWKKLIGFYHDFENEHHSTYTVDGNKIINEDQ